MATWKDAVAIAAILSIFVALVVYSGVGSFVVTTPLTSLLSMGGSGGIHIGGVAVLLGIVVVAAAAGFYYFKHR